MVHHAFLQKLRQSFGVQLPKPVDVALSLIPQVRILKSHDQSIWEFFTSTLESNCQFPRRLAHFASRNIHREVQPPLPRTATESNCRCCRGWFPVSLAMVYTGPGVPSPPDPRMSGVALSLTTSSVPAFCVSMSSSCKHWSPTASSVKQDWERLSTNLSRFSVHWKTHTHTLGSEWISQPTSCT